MSKDQNRIAYSLKAAACDDCKSDDTKKMYRNNIDKFADWAKSEGIKRMYQVADPVDLVNKYVKHLISQNKSPDTIHTYIVPVCKGFGIKRMEGIEKPVRSVNKIVKGRVDKGSRGQLEAQKPCNSRIIAFQRAVGVRKAELYKLTGEELKSRKNGLYVIIRQGKGGKYQMQKILPKDQQVVLDTFKGIGKNERVFSEAEKKTSSKIDMHSLRRQHAQEAYDYYASLSPVDRNKVKMELLNNFKTYHKACIGLPDAVKDIRAKNWYNRAVNASEGLYKLRGDSIERAKQSNRPVVYDRFALLAVSVLHLSHWRIDVTVNNYMM